MVSCWRDPLGASPGVFPRCGVLCYAKLLQLYLTLRSYRLAPQAPLSMGFSRQEYWSGLLYPSPGDLPDPKDQAHVSCIAGRFFTSEPLGQPYPRTNKMGDPGLWRCCGSGFRGLRLSRRGNWGPLGGKESSCTVETDVEEGLRLQSPGNCGAWDGLGRRRQENILGPQGQRTSLVLEPYRIRKASAVLSKF